MKLTTHSFRRLALVLSVTGLAAGVSSSAFAWVPIVDDVKHFAEKQGLGDLGASDYRIVNTTTGACSHIRQFPGGEIGLLQLRGKYPDPHFTVNYGSC